MSAAKYRKGGRITSLDELPGCEFIYIHDKITHYGWFMSHQFRYLYQQMVAGFLFRADRRTDDA